MGASLSAEEEAIVKLLTQLLVERGVENDPLKIKLLLKFLRKQGFPSMASTVFDVKTWDHAGEKICEAASSGDTDAAEVMATWHLVTETLRSWQAEHEADNAAARAAPAGSPAPCQLMAPGGDKEEGRGTPPQRPSGLTLPAAAVPTPGSAAPGPRACDPRPGREQPRRAAPQHGDPLRVALPEPPRPSGRNAALTRGPAPAAAPLPPPSPCPPAPLLPPAAFLRFERPPARPGLCRPPPAAAPAPGPARRPPPPPLAPRPAAAPPQPAGPARSAAGRRRQLGQGWKA
ncbi:uncharacterized protein [Anas acuta]|uniref:uncharacterized protein n=1 Tax=Anas acuta TaxID=28680 RepID=UPI0035C909DA